MAFRVQKLRFAYKYLIVNLQNCISNYKVASRIAIQVLRVYYGVFGVSLFEIQQKTSKIKKKVRKNEKFYCRYK